MFEQNTLRVGAELTYHSYKFIEQREAEQINKKQTRCKKTTKISNTTLDESKQLRLTFPKFDIKDVSSMECTPPLTFRKFYMNFFSFENISLHSVPPICLCGTSLINTVDARKWQ